jgi:nucleoside phosphorylase
LLGLIFALPIEMLPLKAQMVGVARVQDQPQAGFYLGSLEGAQVVLTTAGIGPERAEKATKRLLEIFGPPSPGRIKAVLSLGFAGALEEGIKTGELVVVRNVLFYGSGTARGTPAIYPCHPSLVELSQKAVETDSTHGGFTTHQGDLLTVEELIKLPEDKRKTGLLTGAVAVDMEAAGVAKAAIEARTPFMALKVILDEVDEELKWAGLVDGEGKIKVLETLVHLLYNPWDIIYLKRLNRKAQLAAGELTKFLTLLAREVYKQKVQEEG